MAEELAPVMVLDDGETYSGIRGCYGTLVNAEDAEDIERQLEADEDQPLFFIHSGPLGVVIEVTDLGKGIVNVI